MRGIDWKGPEFAAENLETLKNITMEEKIEFWRKVEQKKPYSGR